MESNLYSAISSLFSGRVFPDFAPPNTQLPYCTYNQAGGKPVQYFSGDPSGDGIARIQINVWSSSRSTTNTLIRQIESIVTQSPLFGKIEGGAISVSEPDLNLYGSIQDFSFKY